MTTGTEFRRLIFIRTDRLGETLLNLPAVAALHAALPQAAVTLLAHPDLQSLLAGLPGVEQVLACPQGPRGLWWMRALQLGCRLRRERFDLAIVSNPKKELHAAVWLAGIPVRIGYDRKWGGLLTHRVPDRKALGEQHEVEYNLNLLRAIGLSITAPQWRLPCGATERLEVRRLLEQQGIQPSEPFLTVHPWTSNPSKQWPIDRYQALLQRSAGQLAVKVVVIGGPEERRRIAQVLPAGAAAVDLVGRLTLRQLAALLERAALLISNDSGPVHLAAAVGTPTVVLFGTLEAATGPRRWGPWGEGHRIILKPSMEEITVEEVVAAVRQQLHERASPHPDREPVRDR